MRFWVLGSDSGSIIMYSPRYVGPRVCAPRIQANPQNNFGSYSLSADQVRLPASDARRFVLQRGGPLILFLIVEGVHVLSCLLPPTTNPSRVDIIPSNVAHANPRISHYTELPWKIVRSNCHLRRRRLPGRLGYIKRYNRSLPIFV
jgi:hypothetical protein